MTILMIVDDRTSSCCRCATSRRSKTIDDFVRRRAAKPRPDGRRPRTYSEDHIFTHLFSRRRRSR